MTPLWTREELDMLLSGVARQDLTRAVVPLTPSCHPTSGVEVLYQGMGILTVRCHTCQHEAARLLLALGTAILIARQDT